LKANYCAAGLFSQSFSKPYMRRIALCTLVFAISLFSKAQSFQVGVVAGIANYQGDLVNKLFEPRFSKAAGGLTATYELTEHWSVRGGFTYTKLTANDKYNTKTYLQARNLNFNTSISELSVVGEYATFSLDQKRWTPYLFGGVALFHFNPYTWDGDAKLYLKPLSTEGQGITGYPESKPYSLTQVALPFGGGVRYAVTENVRIGLELGIRKLFTDHLDDVSGNYADAADLLRERGPLAVAFAYRGDEIVGGSPVFPQKGAQRGGSLQQDWYYITGLTVSFRLGNNTGKSFKSSGRKRGYGCPTSPL
jgi:opacity protein-like surface antigen